MKTLNEIAIEKYGKNYSALPDDGTEQDCINVIFENQTKWTSKTEREEIARETGLQPRKLRIELLTLRSQIHQEIAPAIEQSRAIDDFIASGKSLVGWLKEKTTSVTLPVWARLQAPALPIGLPMPPDKCFNPRITLPAIAV